MIKTIRADALARLQRRRWGQKLVRGWGLNDQGHALFGWWALWPSGGRSEFLGATLARALGAPMSISAAAEKAADLVRHNGIALLVWYVGWGAWVERPLAPGVDPRRALREARREWAAALLERPPTPCICIAED